MSSCGYLSPFYIDKVGTYVLFWIHLKDKES